VSTAARKARKRAGIKFEHTAKVGTPLQDRAWFNELVLGVKGTRYAGSPVPRSWNKKLRALQARDLTPAE